MKIEIISGSVRVQSVTKRVAIHLYHYLKATKDIDVGLIDMALHHLPPVESVFNDPYEAPEDIQSAALRMFNADAIILVTPEYNGSYSPALKNFLDHFPKQKGKVFGIVSASPGSLGGVRAALQLQTLVYGLMGIGSPQMLIVPEVDKKFSKEGILMDEHIRQSVVVFLNDFLWLAKAIFEEGSVHEWRKIA